MPVASEDSAPFTTFTLRSLMRLTGIVAIGLAIARSGQVLASVYFVLILSILGYNAVHVEEQRRAWRIRDELGVANTPTFAGCLFAFVMTALLAIPMMALSVDLMDAVASLGGLARADQTGGVTLVIGFAFAVMLYWLLWGSPSLEAVKGGKNREVGELGGCEEEA